MLPELEAFELEHAAERKSLRREIKSLEDLIKNGVDNDGEAKEERQKLLEKLKTLEPAKRLKK